MKIYILAGFETQSYSTHTVFYATSAKSVDDLTMKFTDWLIEHFNLWDESYDYDTPEKTIDEILLVSAFSNQLWNACSETNNKSNLTRAKLFTELRKCVRIINADELLFDESQVDGD